MGDRLGCTSKRANTKVQGIDGNDCPENRVSRVKGLELDMVTVISYAGAALYQYENMRSRAWALFSEETDWWLHRNKAGYYRRQINEYWNSMDDGQKVAIGIIFLNCLVFLSWRIPSLQPKMIKYFLCNPNSKSLLPMVLSTFSHTSFLHLAINMYVLFSFSSAAGHVLGKEQFAATYISAGVVSSFASLMCKVFTSKANSSLGAVSENSIILKQNQILALNYYIRIYFYFQSGAILGILGFTCTEFPDSKLALVFLPFYTFTAGQGLIAVITMDTAGILFGWKLFDHAAHLGGVLCGM
ncbi:Presenilins-associated rhomboid-like protein, mitochondrial [Nymphon striatum]|nr:Presenilins-associated rhomboid-like protein, mitochondrial [Nymphon striatum]